MSETPDLHYLGGELGLFAQAVNWKRYWASLIAPYLRGDVLEVGAGVGANTRFLRTSAQRRWVCLEPDRRLLETLRGFFEECPPSAPCEILAGTLASVGPDQRFDAAVYIDVLEHIETDRQELEDAAHHLKPGGHLVVLSPAHQWLFSRFDAAIGHFRRYTRRTLLDLTPAGLEVEKAIYLDACGLWLSLANRMLLRQSLPTREQVLLWDRRVVPLSRWLDPLLLHRAGKSILVVWRNNQRAA